MMVDGMGPWHPDLAPRLIPFFGHVAIFESGDSWHAYGLDRTIPQSDWPAWLGSMLLTTERQGMPIIDVRWVGHALRQGSGYLRWSQHPRTGAYPQLVGIFGPENT